MCVCSLSYPTSNAHASYYVVVCGLPGSTIFFDIVSQTARFFLKELLNIKCVFWFIAQILSKTFLILKKNSATDNHKYTELFMWSTRYFCQILMKFEFYRQIFEKYSNIEFHENPSSGSWVVPCGRKERKTDRLADRHDGGIVTFHSFSNASKNGCA